MPRKFVEPDKEKLKQKLMDTGKELFTQFGLKKTGVGEITRAVGIAQGSFYLFYSSKEELFADILMEEEKKVRMEMMERFWRGQKLTRSGFRQFLEASVLLIADNPLLLQLFDSELMNKIMQKLPEEKLQEMFDQDADDLVPSIMAAQEAGIMAPYPPDTVVSLIRSVVLLALHRDEIGPDRYEATVSLMAELLAKSLIVKEDECP